MAADVAEFVLAHLRGVDAVTDLIMDGDSGIFESGTLDPKYLALKETERRETGNPAKVLALIVQDAGEDVTDESLHVQRVLVQLIDRARGLANIRLIRKEVFLALQGRSCKLSAPYTNGCAMVQLLFQKRTGHTQDPFMAADYETLIFTSEVRLDLP